MFLKKYHSRRNMISLLFPITVKSPDTYLTSVVDSVVHSFSSPKGIRVVKFQKVNSTSRIYMASTVDFFVAVTPVCRNDLISWWLILLIFIMTFSIMLMINYNGQWQQASLFTPIIITYLIQKLSVLKSAGLLCLLSCWLFYR